MILQIHDELIFETSKEESKKISKLIKDHMMSVKDSDLHSFSVPLLVDVNFGDNWGDLH
jgi:DNA polymerase I - 3''-5'' exonuclease and polymerase domains